MFSKSMSRNLKAGKKNQKSHGFWQREATAACRAAFSQTKDKINVPSVNSRVLFLYLVSEIVEHSFMIKNKICVTLNGGQGQYN